MRRFRVLSTGRTGTRKLFAAFISFCLKNHRSNPHNPWLLRFNSESFREQALQRFPNSPRNLFPDFLQYISEAPEMTSHDEEQRRPKQQKEN
ncbi:MAG: hypothetical protein DMF08_09270 [Verrucomicrobia bacterium]|nr:MAG: hypothetical protein DMF08_09270 [Verrucomicrobiota bacterium]